MGPRLHTGQPTCFDLSSALGPLGARAISSGTTHNLFVSTLCPLSTSAREQCTVQKHTCTQACALYTHTHRKKKTKRHTQTLYRHRILPHANTVCHTKPCSASVPLPLCLLDLFRLSPPLRLVCLLQEEPSAQPYTGEYPHLVDDVHSIKGETFIVFLCVPLSGSEHWFALFTPQLMRVVIVQTAASHTDRSGLLCSKSNYAV